MSAINESIEETLWAAVHSLHEGSMPIQHIAEHLTHQDPKQAQELIEHARDAWQSVGSAARNRDQPENA